MTKSGKGRKKSKKAAKDTQRKGTQNPCVKPGRTVILNGN